MLEALKGLASSRKFWLVIFAIVVATVLVALNKIEMRDFEMTVVGLVALLVGTIGLEDAAKKFGLPPPAPKPDDDGEGKTLQ